MGLPLFSTEKEYDFFNIQIKEYIQKIIGQRVIYYPLSLEHTQVHDIYDEAIEKVWLPPIQTYALVQFIEPQQSTTSFGHDTRYGLEIFWHKLELKERKLNANAGDIVEYGGKYFEITSITEPQFTFGQINQPVMVKAICQNVREGFFPNIENKALPPNPGDTKDI